MYSPKQGVDSGTDCLSDRVLPMYPARIHLGPFDTRRQMYPGKRPQVRGFLQLQCLSPDRLGIRLTSGPHIVVCTAQLESQACCQCGSRLGYFVRRVLFSTRLGLKLKGRKCVCSSNCQNDIPVELRLSWRFPVGQYRYNDMVSPRPSFRSPPTTEPPSV